MTRLIFRFDHDQFLGRKNAILRILCSCYNGRTIIASIFPTRIVVHESALSRLRMRILPKSFIASIIALLKGGPTENQI